MRALNASLHFGGRVRGLNWELILDTSSPHAESRLLERVESYSLESQSLAVLGLKFPGWYSDQDIANQIPATAARMIP
jgi:hypothetical protein